MPDNRWDTAALLADNERLRKALLKIIAGDVNATYSGSQCCEIAQEALATPPPLAEEYWRAIRKAALLEARARMHRDQTWCQVADMLTDMAEGPEGGK